MKTVWKEAVLGRCGNSTVRKGPDFSGFCSISKHMAPTRPSLQLKQRGLIPNFLFQVPGCPPLQAKLGNVVSPLGTPPQPHSLMGLPGLSSGPLPCYMKHTTHVGPFTRPRSALLTRGLDGPLLWVAAPCIIGRPSAPTASTHWMPAAPLCKCDS